MISGSGRSTGEGIGYPLQYSWASLVSQLVKNLPVMRETWVQSLGWEDPLEKGKATHSIFWPGEFHGLYGPWGRKESDTTESLSLSFTFNGLAPIVALNSEKIGIHQVILESAFIVIIGNINLYNSTIFLRLLP